MALRDQTRIPATYVRGGSSKAIFFREEDIPPPGPLRDQILKRVMGTPDPLQNDGMGGTKATTSKIAIISTSNRPNTDIDYLFVQVGVADDTIAYKGNCGNISAAVGPYAIDEGLVKGFKKGWTFGNSDLRTQELRIFNTGTNKHLIAHVPVDEEGYPISEGDFAIAAVPGTGAPIMLDYRETAGASRGEGLLPSGNAIDKVEVAGREVEITVCDVANICVFSRAEDWGLTGHETAVHLNDNDELIAQLKELRGKTALLLGMCKDWEKVDEQCPFLPMPILVGRPTSPENHISGRLFLDNMCHESMAGTGACCFTACSRIKGSVVHEMVDAKAQREHFFKIEHPQGMIPVAVHVEDSTRDTVNPNFQTLAFVRTARRIMDGHVYVPKKLYDPSSTAKVDKGQVKKTDMTSGNGVAPSNGTFKPNESSQHVTNNDQASLWKVFSDEDRGQCP